MDVRTKVSAVDVLETLRTVVAERPDYVYKPPADQVEDSEGLIPCFYVHGGDDEAVPGCLVGHVLNRHGVALADMAKHEGTGAWTVLDALVDLTGEPDAVAEVRTALIVAQESQDGGATWADALERATRADGE